MICDNKLVHKSFKTQPDEHHDLYNILREISKKKNTVALLSTFGLNLLFGNLCTRVRAL